MLAEEFEIRTAAVFSEENILTVGAALHNVVRLTRNDASGHARYANNAPLAGRKAIKSVTMSLFISFIVISLFSSHRAQTSHLIQAKTAYPAGTTCERRLKTVALWRYRRSVEKRSAFGRPC